MQRKPQKRTRADLPNFFDLDIIGAAGAVMVFLGVVAKSMFDWFNG